MRLKMVGFLARKEILETIRDRRTLMIMIFVPVLLYPLMTLLTSQAQIVHQRKIRKTRYSVGVYGGLLPHRLVKEIEKDYDVRLLRNKKNWKKKLEGKGRLALVIDLKTPPPKKKKPAARSAKTNKQKKKTVQRPPPAGGTTVSPVIPGKTAKKAVVAKKPKLKPRHRRLRMLLVYASTSDRGRLVMRRLRGALQRYQKKEIELRLRKVGLALNFVRPLDLHTRDVVTKTNQLRFILARVLPLLLILMTVMGAFYPAIDLTAGEKERGTLETLLTAPVKSIEIVSGKYIAVTAIAILTGTLNLASLWLTMSQGIRLMGRKMNVSFGISWLDFLMIFGFLVLVALLASALMIAIASLARSFKEGQNYVTPAYLGSLIPTLLATLPGSEPTFASSMIPFTNITFAIQETIKGSLKLWYGGMTLLSMGVAIAGALWLAARLFDHEQVLFRSDNLSATRLLFGSTTQKRMIPSSTEALLLLASLLVLMFYIAMPLQTKKPALGLVVTLWGIIFLPPLLWTRLRNIDFRKTFRLQSFDWKLAPLVIMVVLGALPVVTSLTNWLGPILFPNWQNFLELMQKAITPEHFAVSGGAMFVLIALSPGICEEILFRGFILSGLRKSLKPWPAILLTAFLFAAFHLSVYRLIPTFALGVIMGWLCVRTGSILPAMLFHLTNNGLALVLNMPSVQTTVKTWSKGSSSWAVLGIAVVLLVVGTWQIHRLTRKRDLSEEGVFT